MNPKTTFPLLAALAVSFALAGPAMAGEGGQHGERMFERLDSNGDGAIDADEFRAAGLMRFDRRDADGDGFLDKAEFTAPRERPEGAPELSEAQQERRAEWHARMFSHLDADEDGRVSADEAETAHAQMFARLDADGDGRIAREEMRRPGHGRHGGKPMQEQPKDE